MRKDLRKKRKRTIALVFGTIAGASLFTNISILLGIAGVALFYALWTQTPLKQMTKRLTLLLPFGLGAAILLPFNQPGETMFSLFGFAASVEGVHFAITVLLKMTIAGIGLAYLLYHYSAFQVFEGFIDLGLPAMLVEIMSTMWRYFHLLVDEVNSILKAQRARGMEWRGLLWSKRMYQRFGEMLGGLFIRALSRSNRVYTSMSARGGWHAFQSEQVGIERRNHRMALELDQVSYMYGEIQALEQVSITIPRGAKIALMGHNGAGKSTLISLMNGLDQPSSGEVRLFGEKIDKSNIASIRKQVGVVYQDPDDQIFSPTVKEDVAFGPRNMGLSESEIEQRVQTALGSVGMRLFADRSPFELSYGQKRRVAIAGVLAMQPEIIIMDEPMAFLDPKGRDELQALLESLHFMGMTIIVATHDVDFAAEWAEQIVILKEGKVYAQGGVDLLFDEQITFEAGLHIPRLARPFKLLEGIAVQKPKTIREAAQAIWRLMMHATEQSNVQEENLKRGNGLR